MDAFCTAAREAGVHVYELALKSQGIVLHGNAALARLLQTVSTDSFRNATGAEVYANTVLHVFHFENKFRAFLPVLGCRVTWTVWTTSTVSSVCSLRMVPLLGHLLAEVRQALLRFLSKCFPSRTKRSVLSGAVLRGDVAIADPARG